MTAPLILNFHGIGAPARPYEEGEEPYWISADRFGEILDLADRVERRHPVELSFDDSNDSDFHIAFRALAARGKTADIFVLAGKIGNPGYLTEAQIREMDRAGFRIGSHGLHHRAWTELGDAQLAEETAGSRAILEGVIGKPVTAAGIPFGRYDRRVLAAIRRAGYRTAFSSDGWPRLRAAAPRPRFSVRRDTRLDALERAMTEGASGIRRALQEARLTAKSIR